MEAAPISPGAASTSAAGDSDPRLTVPRPPAPTHLGLHPAARTAPDPGALPRLADRLRRHTAAPERPGPRLPGPERNSGVARRAPRAAAPERVGVHPVLHLAEGHPHGRSRPLADRDAAARQRRDRQAGGEL